MTEQNTRLIEQWLPINQVSTEAIRERAAVSALPAINGLHVWWARRPLTPSRATALLSMIPSSNDSPETRQKIFEILGTNANIHHIAERISLAAANDQRDKDGYKEQRRAFNHNPTQEQLAWLKDKIAEADPILLDVTAGGGSIPFEAGRLGFRTIANELNPVACLILRATCEWPQKFGPQLVKDFKEVSKKFQARVGEQLANIYPEEPQPECSTGKCPHPQRHRCIESCEDPNSCDHPKIGSRNHATICARRDPQTYLWARTVKCPACNSVIPLSPNWRLDNIGTGIHLELDGKECRPKIVHDRTACPDCRKGNALKPCNTATLHLDGKISAGTTSGGVAVCPQSNCGTTTPKGHLAEQARAGRMGHQLYAIIYRDLWTEKTKAGKDKKRPTTFRGFAEVTPDHNNAELIERKMARLEPKWAAHNVLPSEEVPPGNDRRPHIYGMEKWVKMFNLRQQLAHGQCIAAFKEMVDEDRNAARLDECRKAAWSYVALALDKLIDYNSTITVWHPNREVVSHTFTQHAFPMKASYAEMAVTCQGLGLEWALNDTESCLNQILKMISSPDYPAQLLETETSPGNPLPTEVINSEAQFIPQLNDKSIDCIVFDPPYHDNVAYAELSDFFYVWLKRTAGYVFPEDFTRHLAEKDLEAIASPARFKNAGISDKSTRQRATADYEEKMAQIFAECRRVIKSDGIMTVMFTHKSTTAWDALTVALINAGFSITRTWPVKTEGESSMHIKDKAAARTTILLVCRPREHNPTPEPWHRVEELIAKAVREDISDNLSQAELRPIDLYLSAFGPALKIISEHWGTERETANTRRPEAPYAVTPTDALQVARTEVSKHRAQAISEKWANSPVDEATKFYVLANDASGGVTMEFDEANLLARAIGTNLDRQDPVIGSIAAFKNGKVSLLSAKDRMAAGYIGEIQTPKISLDLVHTAVALTERRNTMDTQQWLEQKLYDPQEERFKSTLEALIRTTKPGHDDHQAQRSLWQALYGEEAPEPAATQGTQGILL